MRRPTLQILSDREGFFIADECEFDMCRVRFGSMQEAEEELARWNAEDAAQDEPEQC